MVQALSLFSGCGGCSLGLRQAGIEVVLAADKDTNACASYSGNLQGSSLWSGIDLSTITPRELVNRAKVSAHAIDVIVGGPPCQGFSSAGAKDWRDPRNALVRTFVETVTSLRPTWFIMENVEGFLTANDGFYLIEAVARFLEAGYWVRVKKIYLEQFGIPQKRKRVFIVGNLEEITFNFPPPSHGIQPSLWTTVPPFLSVLDAISDLPEPDSENQAAYAASPANEYQAKMRRVDGQPITLHQQRPVNELTLQRIALLEPGATMKHLPERLQHPSFQRRAYRRVMDGTPTEKRGGAPSGLKRLTGNSPSLTITSASATEFIHPTQNRILTLRECARIQSFPDWYEFRGSWNSIATQIGNAIPPLLMKQLAEHILRLATWQRSTHTEGCWLGIDATKASAMSPALERSLSELDRRTAIYA